MHSKKIHHIKCQQQRNLLYPEVQVQIAKELSMERGRGGGGEGALSR